MKINAPAIIVVLNVLYAPSAFAASPVDEAVQVGRYSYLAPMATPEQTNPLSVVVSLKLPQQIENVGTAIEFLLQRSGYRLEKNFNKEATAMLYDLAIPAVHRDLGPITLENALQTLTGPEWDLKINKLTRKITFFARDYRYRPDPFPGAHEDEKELKDLSEGDKGMGHVETQGKVGVVDENFESLRDRLRDRAMRAKASSTNRVWSPNANSTPLQSATAVNTY